MKNEIWKDIKNYEGFYQVSNLGRVKSLTREIKLGDNIRNISERILNTYSVNGYLTVNLCKDGSQKLFYVHRLVAEAFIPNPLNLSDVNHISEIKSDCTVSNLEWMSHKDNCNYGTRNRRISKRVYCEELNKVYTSITEAATELGLNVGNINRACKGIYKTTGKYHWSYVQ